MFFLIVNGIIAVLCLIGVIYTFGSMQVEIDADTMQAIGDTSDVDMAVSFSIWFTLGSLILITGFTIWAIIDNPKRFIPSFIGLAVFFIIFFISYGYGSAIAEPSGRITMIQYSTPEWVLWSGTGIIMTYIMSALAVMLIVAGMVRGLLSFMQK